MLGLIWHNLNRKGQILDLGIWPWLVWTLLNPRVARSLQSVVRFTDSGEQALEGPESPVNSLQKNHKGLDTHSVSHFSGESP